MTGWTETRVDDLKRLWDEGHSGSEIAAVFHMTRCAVLGKIHRMGWSRNIPHEAIPKEEANRRRSEKKRLERWAVNPGLQWRYERPKVCRTIIKSKERKPAAERPPSKPGLMTVLSVLTGSPLPVRRRQSLGQALTKNEMRAMLTLAVQNTAAMEVVQ